MTSELFIPPHSQNAEEAVIGGLLIDAQAINQVADMLEVNDFYRRENRNIYEAMIALDAGGEDIDVITVPERMKRLEKWDGDDSMQYIGRLAKDTPSSANIRAYAKIVRDRSVQRQLIKAGMSFAQIIDDEEDVSSQLDAAQQKVLDIGREKTGGPMTVKEHLPAWVDRLDSRSQAGGRITGLETGFYDFDAMTGGLGKGDLIIAAGRPSMGKSAWAMNIADHVSRDGTPTLVFSMEMPAEQLIDRQVAARTNIPLGRIRDAQLDADQWPRVSEQTGKISQQPLIIDESGSLSATDIRARSRRVKQRHGLGLIVVDYLQLISGSRKENRNQEITEISRSLKIMAKDLGCAVIALSQLNRGVEQRANKRPLMSDLRECLPVSEWVDTPIGPAQLKTRPGKIITAGRRSAAPSGCDFIEKRYNRTYRVDTSFGSFSATAKHQVLTGTGWKRVRDLKPGRDVVACPKRIEHANRGAQPHARLLGWLIGNGYLKGTPNLVYRKELSDDVVAAVAPFGVSVREKVTQKSENVIEAYFSNGVESGCLPNPIMTWIRELGLEGKQAAEKAIPDCYLGTSDETHKELLRGLWEADGTVTAGVAKYATCSEVLARQVKWLLHTIGVRATINWYDNGHQGMWDVRCAIEDNDRMREICVNRHRFGELKDPSTRYIDPAPAIFVELVDEMYQGDERIQRRADGSVKQIPKARMKRIMSQCPISTINESPYMSIPYMGWSTVSSVEVEDREVRVCDLHVPETHCFLTNGLVVHNSGAIEQDADVIVFLYRDEVYNDNSTDKGTAEIIIGKQRNGPTGTCDLLFQGEYTRFANLAQQDKEALRERRREAVQSKRRGKDDGLGDL